MATASYWPKTSWGNDLIRSQTLELPNKGECSKPTAKIKSYMSQDAVIDCLIFPLVNLPISNPYAVYYFTVLVQYSTLLKKNKVQWLIIFHQYLKKN